VFATRRPATMILLALAGLGRGAVHGRDAAAQKEANAMGTAAVVVESPADCRVEVDGERGTWSLDVAGRRVISQAAVGVVVPRPVAIPEGTRFLKFRLFQRGGDWDAYIGYLEFRAGDRPLYKDGFTSQTPREQYVRADNLLWRTETEGGLICPDARDVWAEIVYETRATEVRWVYQVVHEDDAIEVQASPDGAQWMTLVRKSGEGGIQPHFRDEDAAPLAATVTESLGPARCRTEAVQDRLGEGRQATLERTLPDGLRLRAEITLLDREPVALLDLSLTNPTHEPLEVLSLHPGSGFEVDVGGPAERCTVLSNDYWFAPRQIVQFGREQETTEWWSTAVIDRSTEQALILGIAEAANAGVTFRVRREGARVCADIDANLSPTGSQAPLLMPGGTTVRLCRLAFLFADQLHTGLERYGDLVAANAEVKLRHPAYSGLFTGYSSSPDLTTVVRLDEPRVMHLLELLKQKVGRYGIDFVKIEFEPCGSPNLLDPTQYRMEDYFPRGPQALTDAIRKLGFRPALQSRTFAYVQAGDPEEQEKTRALYRRFTQEWGFEYLMLDFNETDLQNADRTRPRIQAFRDRFRMIREAVGPDVFIEACMIPYGPVIGLADGYRASQDYRGGNEDSQLGNFATRYYLHGRVLQLDTEFFDLAQRPFVWSARNVVTPTAGTRAWVSLCGLTGYSFLFGGAIEETSDERWHIASRALPVTGVAARPIDLAENALPEVWSLTVPSGGPRRQTVGLFNWDYEGAKTVEVSLAKCGLPPGKTFAAFDFWQQRFLGEVTDRLDARLVARNGQVVWLTEIADRPEIIGASRHLTGFFSGKVTGWDPAALRLEGVVSGLGDDRVSLFIHVPQRLGVRSAEGATCEQVEEKVVRLDVPAPAGEAKWSVQFDRDASVR